MKSRSKNFVAAILGLSLFATAIAKAGPVQIKNVQQVIKGTPATGWHDGNSELRTNTPTTDPITDPKTKKENTDPKKNETTTDPALQQDVQVRTETFEEFIEDTACNCPSEPEPLIATGRSFPWWILGAGALPLAFIDREKKINPPPDNPPGSSPTPSNTPPGVPEPATLLLFGSGLLALGIGARRRFRNNDDTTGQTPTVGEG